MWFPSHIASRFQKYILDSKKSGHGANMLFCYA